MLNFNSYTLSHYVHENIGSVLPTVETGIFFKTYIGVKDVLT